jgi:hypothetical protein
VSDVLRGAFVLAFAALDGVVLDAVVEAVPIAAQGGLGGEALTKWIREEPARILDGVAEDDLPSALADIARRSIGHTTFQRAAAIEGVLRDALGCGPPWEAAAAELSAATGLLWTPEDVREYLDDYVERRNNIAHSGDRPSGARTATPIQVRYVRTAIELARAVGHAVCGVVEDRLNTA